MGTQARLTNPIQEPEVVVHHLSDLSFRDRVLPQERENRTDAGTL
jgi:hypothetical protein